MARSAHSEKSALAAMNAFLEPAALAGLLSSPVWPVGVISLETQGRRSGRLHRVPVLAMHAEGYVLVTTARGTRSDWFRNLEVSHEVRYWLAGRGFEARAIVLLPDGDDDGTLPESVACAVASASTLGRAAGWRFAVLAPRVTAQPSL